MSRDLLDDLAVNLIPEVLLFAAQLWGREGQEQWGWAELLCDGVRDGMGSEVGEILLRAGGWGPSQGDSPVVISQALSHSA